MNTLPRHVFVRIGVMLLIFGKACLSQTEPKAQERPTGALPADILRKFQEDDDLLPTIRKGEYKVIYRFVAAPTERFLHMFILRVSVRSSISPIQSDEADVHLKVLTTESPKLLETSSKLKSNETRSLLTAIQQSEIFRLAGTTEDEQADDGGSYLLFGTASAYTYFFERTTNEGVSSVQRLNEVSLPAKEAGAAFNQIAEALFQKLQKK